jgi:hypothetical protein
MKIKSRIIKRSISDNEYFEEGEVHEQKFKRRKFKNLKKKYNQELERILENNIQE